MGKTQRKGIKYEYRNIISINDYEYRNWLTINLFLVCPSQTFLMQYDLSKYEQLISGILFNDF